MAGIIPIPTDLVDDMLDMIMNQKATLDDDDTMWWKNVRDLEMRYLLGGYHSGDSLTLRKALRFRLPSDPRESEGRGLFKSPRHIVGHRGHEVRILGAPQMNKLGIYILPTMVINRRSEVALWRLMLATAA